MIQRVLATVLMLCCFGCASTPEATPERDAAAKLFEPVERDSVIYIYRDDYGIGTGSITTLWIDGRLIGDSLARTFFRVIVFPGKHVITTSGPDMGRIEVETRPYQVTYVAMTTLGGDGAPSSFLRWVNPDRARETILACCTLLEAWRPGQPRLVW